MKTKWVCIQLACSLRPHAFGEAHHRNIQAKFYNERFPLVYESDNMRDSLYQKHGATLKHNKWDSLYEGHGATLKHKCGKRDSNIAPFFGPSFFGLSLFWDNALLNDDHHTSFYLQLNDYNSILEQSMTLYECLRRCTGIAMMPEWLIWKNYERWLCHN